MPFRLNSAPTVFQALVNDVLWDWLSQFMFVYSITFRFFSPDLGTHQKHVCQVLLRLYKNQLSSTIFLVIAEKCEFHSAAVSFFGFSNFYCKFIKNFISVAAPLHALT